MIFTWAVLFFGGLGLFWYYLTYNSLINTRNAVDQSWSNIEVELKRRLDLIDNLISVVKGYTKHEADTLTAVTAMRANSHAVGSASSANAVEPGIKSSIAQIMAIAEAYPVLRADGQFLNLQTELSNTENRIAERRSNYNLSVSMLKNRCGMFPSSIIADMHGFADRAFFDAPDEEINKVPEVKI